ncbi:MAG: Hint domain-containing protein [Pseudomonadota bacterium]
MSWVGLADCDDAEFDLTGLASRRRNHASQMPQCLDSLAYRGTIMVEANVAQFTVPRPLINHQHGEGFWLDMAFGTDDTLDFTLTIGDQMWEARLPLVITDMLHPVRITYSWDVATRAAILSVCQPRSYNLEQILLYAPRPIPWAALHGLIQDAPAMCRSNDVTYLAVSRGFEPAGMMPGVEGGTPVATTQGNVEMAKIRAGDTIITKDGRHVPVLGRLQRTLPARGSFTPFNLRAPYLGLKRDVILAGEALVQLEGADVEYLLGCERVLAQVNQLGEGKSSPLRSDHPTVSYHQLVFDGVEILNAGVGICSMNFATQRPNRIAAAATLWADLHGNWPGHHGTEPHPIARPYEIVTINASRAA